MLLVGWQRYLIILSSRFRRCFLSFSSNVFLRFQLYCSTFEILFVKLTIQCYQNLILWLLREGIQKWFFPNPPLTVWMPQFSEHFFVQRPILKKNTHCSSQDGHIFQKQVGTYSRSKWVGETDLVWTCSELFKSLALSYRSKTTFCAYDQKNLMMIMMVAMIIMMIMMVILMILITKMTKNIQFLWSLSKNIARGTTDP